MMETIVTTTPGYRVYDYMLVLAPHAELSGRLKQLREEFCEKFRVQQPRRGWIYLPLVTFSQYAMAEDRILNNLRLIAMGYPPFRVELKDFGSFPSHTIYVQATTKVPIQQLVKNIRSSAQKLMKLSDENKPHFIMEPHITVAGKLLPWQYEKAWAEYMGKHFSGKFVADSMLLLRKAEGESRYQATEKFSFQNLPVATRQGELAF